MWGGRAVTRVTITPKSHPAWPSILASCCCPLICALVLPMCMGNNTPQYPTSIYEHIRAYTRPLGHNLSASVALCHYIATLYWRSVLCTLHHEPPTCVLALRCGSPRVSHILYILSYPILSYPCLLYTSPSYTSYPILSYPILSNTIRQKFL